MHSSITILYLTHSYFSLHNSFRWFHILHLPSCAGAVITYYQMTISKENNQQVSVGMGDMLETDQTFTSNISQLFINACKLQLKDHTYTMIYFSQNQFSSHLQISKCTPVFDRFGMAALIVCLESQVATHTFFIFNCKQTDNRC